MNIEKKIRNQSIQSLEFLDFLEKLRRSLKDSYDESTNPLILDFLKVVEEAYFLELKKSSPYLQALTDYVFWKSRNFYRETMQKFASGELNALEFAQEFSDRLLADREKANNLTDDFRKQATIELDPKIFEFSKIILSFDLPLELYQNEVEELETGELFEDELSFKPNSILEAVKHALEEINKYFTD